MITTQLDDSTTGRYIHTLSTAGIFVAGAYGCVVSHNKSSAMDEVKVDRSPAL